MNKREYISKVLSKIDGRVYLNEIRAELEGHIEDRREYYINTGYNSEAAEQKAVEHMGNADIIGEEMNMLYNYKKHKIISIAGLSILSLLFLIQLVIVSLFRQPFFTDNTLSLILLCLIYGCTIHSRGRTVMLLQGIISFGLFFYLFCQFFESGIFMQTITFFIHGIICLTCTAEINSAIKANSNQAILQRYRVWEKILYLLTAICIFITVIHKLRIFV